jgi:HEAT repeat protein
MKAGGADPEYQRYRRTYPKFPGVNACVELLRRRNVQGAYLDGVMGDLNEHATANVDELLVAFGAEPEARVRALLLSVIAEAAAPAAFPTFAQVLFGDDEDLRIWAARGLHILGTPDSRRVLFEARSKQLSDPAATERFQQMLSDVERWK